MTAPNYGPKYKWTPPPLHCRLCGSESAKLCEQSEFRQGRCADSKGCRRRRAMRPVKP